MRVYRRALYCWWRDSIIWCRLFLQCGVQVCKWLVPGKLWLWSNTHFHGNLWPGRLFNIEQLILASSTWISVLPCCGKLSVWIIEFGFEWIWYPEHSLLNCQPLPQTQGALTDRVDYCPTYSINTVSWVWSNHDCLLFVCKHNFISQSSLIFNAPNQMPRGTRKDC